MKKIGLIGGMTPESTILYYRILNSLAAEHYGDAHSSKVVINSVDFGEIAKLQKEGRWDLLDEIMADAAINLEKAGVSYILICANTMHLTIDAVKKAVSVPVIHIADATAKQIVAKKMQKVALLGTKYTMEKTFYTDVLTSFGVDTIIPDENDRQIIHDVIYDELSKGKLNPISKQNYCTIIDKLIERGAEGIILGCTEIPLLITQDDVSVPVFDTTEIHATAVFNLAIKE